MCEAHKSHKSSRARSEVGAVEMWEGSHVAKEQLSTLGMFL